MPGPGFDPSTVMDAIQKHHITHILLVPFQLHALVKHESFTPEKTKSVINAKFGGDMITKEVLKKAQRSFPMAQIAAGHGMTEGGAVFAWPYFGKSVDDIPDFGGISAVGTVAPGSALRIYDNENGRVAKFGETGEFQMASPATIKRYLENVDQEAFVQDGPDRWFKTGDVGFINKKCEVFLLGRLTERIKRAGIRIEPAALQTSLSEFVGAQVSPLCDLPTRVDETRLKTIVTGRSLRTSSSRVGPRTIRSRRKFQRQDRRSGQAACDRCLRWDLGDGWSLHFASAWNDSISVECDGKDNEVSGSNTSERSIMTLMNLIEWTFVTLS